MAVFLLDSENRHKSKFRIMTICSSQSEGHSDIWWLGLWGVTAVTI